MTVKEHLFLQRGLNALPHDLQPFSLHSVPRHYTRMLHRQLRRCIGPRLAYVRILDRASHQQMRLTGRFAENRAFLIRGSLASDG